MISKIMKTINLKGSSLTFSAHGWRGKEKNLSAEKSVRPKVLGAKPKQAGKKEGGWGEGIFARLLPFPFRLSKGKAEGGFGGNSPFPLRNQNEASPATCLNTWKAGHHRKILFSLEEKEIRRAQNEKSKEYFSVVWPACRAVAGLASLVWFRSAVFDKMSSSQTVKTHQNLTFGKLTDFFVGGAKRRPLILWGEFRTYRRANARLSARQDEVRLPCDFNSVSDLLCPIIL